MISISINFFCLICFSDEEEPQTKLENNVRLFHLNGFRKIHDFYFYDFWYMEMDFV